MLAIDTLPFKQKLMFKLIFNQFIFLELLANSYHNILKVFANSCAVFNY